MVYEYRAKIIEVVDGDTVTAEVNLGFRVLVRMRLRLEGIDAPETFGVPKDSEEYKAGMKAKEWLQARIFGKNCMIETFKDKQEKYGRYLATVFVEGVNVNQEFLGTGLVKAYG